MIEQLEVPKHIRTDQKISDFKKGKFIAEGSFGEVSEVEDLSSGKHYALKKIDKGAYKDIGDETKILTEVQHLIILSPHPYICSIVSIFEEGKYFYIVQDLCGIQLKKAMENPAVDEAQRMKWFYQLVVAIDFCHSRRILHLDLKTENVLVSAEGTIKLIDFGISQFEERVVHEEAGTLDYLPPEIMRSEDVYVGKGADMWALGVICYEMFAGKYPFGKTLKEIMRNVLEVNYDAIAVPAHIRPIVQGLLQEDYNERWTTRDILNYLNSL